MRDLHVQRKVLGVHPCYLFNDLSIEKKNGLEEWAKELPKRLQIHVRCKWWLYAKTLFRFYRFFVDAYEAKQAYNKKDLAEAKAKRTAVCEGLEDYLTMRKCVEVGESENWYKGELKINVAKRLFQAKEVLQQL